MDIFGKSADSSSYMKGLKDKKASSIASELDGSDDEALNSDNGIDLLIIYHAGSFTAAPASNLSNQHFHCYPLK